MIRFTVFDRWGLQIGTLPQVIEAVHKDEINGEDSLTLVLPSPCDLAKGQRIVWRDKWLEWHEHTVSDIKTVHGEGQLLTTAYCENSIAELMTDYVENLRPQGANAQQALEKALSTSRWLVGRVDDLGTASTSFYHVSAYEAVGSVLEAWGGEVSTTIEVGGTQVVARKVNVTKRRGRDNGKRFSWDKDIVSIEREVSADDVCTALYGYGKGLEKTDEEGEWTGGYERKLTFGDINGGLDWVGDEAAKLKWGLPDGKGGVKHTFGKAEFPDCEDKAELLRLTKNAVAERSKPYVVYTSNVLNLADAGFEYEDSRTGDTVSMVDGGIDERLRGRVLCVERYLFNEKATVMTLGNVSRSISSVISGQTADLKWLRDHSASWDGAASVTDSYINRVIDNMNTAMNATGGYTYYRPGEGIITYDKPEGQNPTMAIQIKGAGFRIANAKKSNGEWDWRTFGTGDGFTADCITAGTIRGGSANWNLEAGQYDNVYVIGENLSYTGSGVTTYSQNIVLVRMDASNALGVYKGTRSRSEWSDGRETFGAITGLTRKGVVFVTSDGEVAFSADYLAANPADIGTDTGTRVRFGAPNSAINGGVYSPKKGINMGTRLSEDLCIVGDTIYTRNGLTIKDANGNAITMNASGTTIKDATGNSIALGSSGIGMRRGASYFGLHANGGTFGGMQFSGSNGASMMIGNIGSFDGISILTKNGKLQCGVLLQDMYIGSADGSRGISMVWDSKMNDDVFGNLYWRGRKIA